MKSFHKKKYFFFTFLIINLFIIYFLFKPYDIKSYFCENVGKCNYIVKINDDEKNSKKNSLKEIAPEPPSKRIPRDEIAPEPPSKRIPPSPKPKITNTPIPTPTSSYYRTRYYNAVIIGEKPIVVDYSYIDGDMSMLFLNKGHSFESAGTKVLLPRVLKGAYKKNDQDQGFMSGIVVMNTENKTTNFKLKIYQPNGSAVLKEYSFTLTPYGSVPIWPPSYNDWPTNPADPPAVIEADGKVVVSVDLRNQSGEGIPGSRRGGAYEGVAFEKTSKTWYSPIILRNAYNEGWESGFIIQNAEDSTANLSIILYGLDNNYQKTCSNISISPYGQRKIYFPDPNSNDCFRELINDPNYNNNRKYSAKIISDKKIAVVVSLASIDKRKAIEENAIPQELVGNTIFVPRVYNNYYGWISSFTLQNTSNNNCNFNVKYIRNDGIIETSSSGICYTGSINPLKSVVVFPPNMAGQACIPEGNNFYSAVIENCSMAGFYHLAYPKNQIDNNTFINRSGGAAAFSEKEISTVFFIPRFYFYSYNWQTGLQIQDASGEKNNVTVYILNNQGKVLLTKTKSFQPYQAVSFYSASDFNELVVEPQPGNYPPLPSVQIPTPTITPIPTPSCPKKNQGDANCDGLINEQDFNIWKSEFLNSPTNKTADFNNDNRVTLIDFEILRRGIFSN